MVSQYEAVSRDGKILGGGGGGSSSSSRSGSVVVGLDGKCK